jgi:hypothetical protein
VFESLILVAALAQQLAEEDLVVCVLGLAGEAGLDASTNRIAVSYWAFRRYSRPSRKKAITKRRWPTLPSCWMKGMACWYV